MAEGGIFSNFLEVSNPYLAAMRTSAVRATQDTLADQTVTVQRAVTIGATGLKG